MERLGHENLVMFGQGMEDLPCAGDYRPYEMLEKNPDLKSVFSFLEKALAEFPDGHTVYPLLASLQDTDLHYVLYDFEDYVKKQNLVDDLYIDRLKWLNMSLMSIAKSGWFSSDRAIRDYARKVWGIEL
jgi:starch phosphorylase